MCVCVYLCVCVCAWSARGDCVLFGPAHRAELSAATKVARADGAQALAATGSIGVADGLAALRRRGFSEPQAQCLDGDLPALQAVAPARRRTSRMAAAFARRPCEPPGQLHARPVVRWIRAGLGERPAFGGRVARAQRRRRSAGPVGPLALQHGESPL